MGYVVTSALAFGNPTNVANRSYDLGTSYNNGKLDPIDCTAYKDIYRSWCDKGDNWCDAEGSNGLVHLAYFVNDDYVKQAVEFVKMRAGLR